MNIALLIATAAAFWWSGREFGRLTENDRWINILIEHRKRMPRAWDLATGRQIPVALLEE